MVIDWDQVSGALSQLAGVTREANPGINYPPIIISLLTKDSRLCGMAE